MKWAVHQENGGHGIAVMKRTENADGNFHYKVVDSDDWVDADALEGLLKQLRRFPRSRGRGWTSSFQLRVRSTE